MTRTQKTLFSNGLGILFILSCFCIFGAFVFMIVQAWQWLAGTGTGADVGFAVLYWIIAIIGTTIAKLIYGLTLLWSLS